MIAVSDSIYTPVSVGFFQFYIRLFADLLADCIFLLVQNSLLGFGDMTAILTRHRTFFLPNLPIFPMQLCCFRLAHFTVFDFILDARILLGKTIIHLLAPGMIFSHLVSAIALPATPANTANKVVATTALVNLFTNMMCFLSDVSIDW